MGKYTKMDAARLRLTMDEMALISTLRAMGGIGMTGDRLIRTLPAKDRAPLGALLMKLLTQADFITYDDGDSTASSDDGKATSSEGAADKGARSSKARSEGAA